MARAGEQRRLPDGEPAPRVERAEKCRVESRDRGGGEFQPDRLGKQGLPSDGGQHRKGRSLVPQAGGSAGPGLWNQVSKYLLRVRRVLFRPGNRRDALAGCRDGSEIIGRTRLPNLANVYPSPVGAGGRIYFPGRNGSTVVLERGKGREPNILATNELDDTFHASPALAGNQIFLRGQRFLYCLEEGGTFQFTP